MADAKTVRANLADRLELRLRTIRFQTALFQSEISVALSNEWTVPNAIDNSVCYVGGTNPVRLWSQMVIRRNDAIRDARSEAIAQQILDILLRTGASKFLNQIDPTDGCRPIDVANADQRRFLCRNVVAYNIDLQPTATRSPLFRCATGQGYFLSSIVPIVAAIDPATLDWIEPVSGATALHAFCTFASGDMDADVLQSIDYLLSFIGFVDPAHACFDADPITHPLLVPRLAIARELTAEYRSVHLPDQIIAGIVQVDGSKTPVWSTIVPAIVGYVF